MCVLRLCVDSSPTSKGTPVESSAAVGSGRGVFSEVAHGEHEGLVQGPGVARGWVG